MPDPEQEYELFARLLSEHGAALALYARQWGGSPEDAVQEALIKLVQQSPRPENPVGWLYRVVRNQSITAARGRRARDKHEAARGTRRSAWFEPDPASALDAAEAQRRLAELPLDAREVVVLRVWGGRTFEEIGELLGVSSSTAHRRYEAALAELRAAWRTTCENMDR